MEPFTQLNREQILTQWMQAYMREMIHWAKNRLPSLEVAEDLVQDTFLVAFQKMDGFEERSQPKTWLFSILKNKIADHFRASFKLETRPLNDHLFFDENDTWKNDQWPSEWQFGNDDNLLDNLEFKSVLDDCQEKLPTNWYQALMLKYFSEKNPSEICKEMGITQTNYWQLVHRAKLQLRKCLEINWFRK